MIAVPVFFLPYRKLRCKTHEFTSSLSELAENAKHSFLEPIAVEGGDETFGSGGFILDEAVFNAQGNGIIDNNVIFFRGNRPA